MNASKTLLASLVLFSTLGFAAASVLGFATLGASFASLGILVLAAADYSHASRYELKPAPVARTTVMSHLRFAP